VIAAALGEPPDAGGQLNIRLWDPSTQLRFRRKSVVPPRPGSIPDNAEDAA
jgi:hypothetical protein